jgi:excisionase family DNA binding protein
MQEDGRLVLTVTEAARALGISRALAYELVARGELPALSLGRRRVIPRRALEALVNSVTPPAHDDALRAENGAE